MIAEQRSQVDAYHAAVDDAGQAVGQLDPELGVNPEIQGALDAALKILNESGRALSRAETFRSQG